MDHIERDSGLMSAPEAEAMHELVRLQYARAGLSLGDLERERPDLVVALAEAGVLPEQVRALLEARAAA